MDWLVDVSPGDLILPDGVIDDGLGGGGASEWLKSYPVLAPEKATKAPELAILFGLVLGSAGI